MSKRIIISVISDLYTDQRVLKTANTCYNNGFEVLLVGRSLKKSESMELSFKTKRFRLLFNHSALFFAEFNIRLFFLLLFSRADIFLSNDTDSLSANFLAAKIRGKKLVFDAHELYPGLPELQQRNFVQKFWSTIEDIIFPHLKNSYTVCDSISNHYKNKYGIEMKVVRNMPYYAENADRKRSTSKEKIIIYQGALNVGRGLEWVLNAMPLINNARLLIIGDGDIAETLKQMAKNLDISDRVTFTGRLESKKMREYTISADLGLCILENKGLSYYYSLPNRIFDYLNADVQVLASDFPEIRNIVEKYRTGRVINRFEPEFLASVINDMLRNPISTEHFKTLSKEFCWENEEKVILDMLQNLK